MKILILKDLYIRLLKFMIFMLAPVRFIAIKYRNLRLNCQKFLSKIISKKNEQSIKILLISDKWPNVHNDTPRLSTKANENTNRVPTFEHSDKN